MRRFAGALALSIVVHTIALLVLSTILKGGGPLPETGRLQPLSVFLASYGRDEGTGTDAQGAGSANPRKANPLVATAGTPPESPPKARPSHAVAPSVPHSQGVHRSTTGEQVAALRGEQGVASTSHGTGRSAPDGGEAGSGSGPGTVGGRGVAYEQVLAAWLNAHKYYPSSLRRRGIEGEGKLRIRISRSGRLLGVDVAAAFPHPSLEAISEDWVNRAQPFPPVPEEIPGDDYVFIVPVGFRLR